MNIAILMETSGVIREAFRKKGHNVVSVDLLPSDDNSPFHVQMDVFQFLQKSAVENVHNKYGQYRFDLVIAHPTCTCLCVSGNHVYAKGKIKHQMRLDAIRETERLWDWIKSNSKKFCFENPVGVLPSMSKLPKPQYIQPYQFGEDASKKTGLYMFGLPELEINPDDYFPPRIVQDGKYKGCKRWSNQTDSGQNKLAPSSDRWKLRSKTYQGIAEAMTQWG